MTWNYNIKPIDLDDIVNFDKEKYNSNNHWVDGIRPDDYDQVLSYSNTDKWIDLFKTSKKLVIDNPTHLEWIKKASLVCSITGKFSNLYSDELEQTCLELSKQINYTSAFDGTGYFVKVNNVSLKYGVNGSGPYYNIKSIIESIVSSIKGHTPINRDTEKLNIYLIPWIDIEPVNEFRVFVHNNKITAISQQDLYSKLFVKKYPGYNTVQMNGIIIEKLNIIMDYFYQEMIWKINWIPSNSYTFDFAIVNSQPYLIELNSFGTEYAAGSALFHWIIDKDILYNSLDDNDNGVVEFRYTV
jgi:hypothetical protein